MKRKYWLLLLVFAVLLNGSPVLADGDFYVVAVGGGVGTKITSLPYTITAPGFYYVTGNLACGANLNGITVNSDNVTIDLMGFRLIGLAGIGVLMSDRKNVEIRNGTLQGWVYGILEESLSAQNHRVINVRMKSNGTGIFLNGSCHLVKGCVVSDCYGLTSPGISAHNSTVSGNQVNNCLRYGIMSSGGIISNNLVSDCGIIGIWGSGTIRANTVYNSSSANAYGIQCSGVSNVIGNMVYTVTAGQTGIYLTDMPIVMDQNAVGGDGTRYSGGGSNVVWAGKNSDNPWGSNAGHP